MKAVTTRRAQAEIIGTLILIAASALMTTLMLFWGLSLQGQSNTNYGQAIGRTNAQAAEQISIDNVLFTKVLSSSLHGGCPGSGSYCYNATVYARNFGDNPIQLAGINTNVLASGITPNSYHCEVTTSSGTSTVHAVIVARAMLPFALYLPSGSRSSTAPGCTSSTTFSSTWNGQTISIQIATAAGSQFSANFAVPP